MVAPQVLNVLGHSTDFTHPDFGWHGRENNGHPKGVHSLTPGTYKYVTLDSKQEIRLQMELKSLTS